MNRCFAYGKGLAGAEREAAASEPKGKLRVVLYPAEDAVCKALVDEAEVGEAVEAV